MKKMIKLILIIIILTININQVNADGYTISLSATSINKGNNVTLYIKGTNIAGGFNVTSSDTTVASVSTSSVWVDNNTEAITISTYKEGNTTITVAPISVSDYNGNDLNLSTKTLNLNVKSKTSNNNNSSTTTKKSSDNTLKSLSIESTEISPKFNSNTLEYSTQLPAETSKIKITATPNDEKATITGIGEIAVTEGVNRIEIVVTAEDATTKTYIINATVKEQNPIKIKINNKEYTVIRKESELPEIELFEKSKINIEETEVIGYYSEKLNIYLVGLKDSKGKIGLYVYDTKKEQYVEFKWISIGGITLQLKDNPYKNNNFKKYHITINNTQVDIYKINKKDESGLIYGTNIATGKSNLYIYDKEEETLSKYYDKEVKIYQEKINDYKNYLMLFMGITSAIIIIIVVISLIKTKKRKRKINR